MWLWGCLGRKSSWAAIFPSALALIIARTHTYTMAIHTWARGRIRFPAGHICGTWSAEEVKSNEKRGKTEKYGKASSMPPNETRPSVPWMRSLNPRFSVRIFWVQTMKMKPPPENVAVAIGHSNGADRAHIKLLGVYHKPHYGSYSLRFIYVSVRNWIVFRFVKMSNLIWQW